MDLHGPSNQIPIADRVCESSNVYPICFPSLCLSLDKVMLCFTLYHMTWLLSSGRTVPNQAERLNVCGQSVVHCFDLVNRCSRKFDAPHSFEPTRGNLKADALVFCARRCRYAANRRRARPRCASTRSCSCACTRTSWSSWAARPAPA